MSVQRICFNRFSILHEDMSISRNKRLIVFTRYPKPGTTKTRLIPVLGAEGAADLQRKMTEHTLLQVKKLLTRPEICIEIRYEGGDEHRMRSWLGPNFDYCSQGSGDLGIRMKRSFDDSFRTGADKTLVIGSDIPAITHSLIQKAFSSLDRKQMVIGPAKDGGYYLIGFQKASFSSSVSGLFTGIKWGERNVLDKTIHTAKDLGINFSLLEELEDVDRTEDLPIWRRFHQANRHDFTFKRISIIIPVLNEADNLKKTIVNIGHQENKEIIVVDGGSSDVTVSLAKSLGVKVVDSSPPRAKQMNDGAGEASGDVLLFLHADTRLPENFDEHVFQCLKQPGVVAGAFELNIDSDAPALRLIERLANFRSKYLNLPYGDQAIFVPSKVFHQMGGFPHIPIMEDFEMVKQLGKKGKIVTLPFSVVTSPRRWKNLGILKTTLINQIVIVMYCAGFPPNKIARWYRRSKGITRNR